MVGVRKQPCSASALNHAQVRGEEMPQQNTSCICLLENKYWFRVYVSIWSFFSFAFCLRRGAVHFKGCALAGASLSVCPSCEISHCESASSQSSEQHDAIRLTSCQQRQQRDWTVKSFYKCLFSASASILRKCILFSESMKVCKK